MAAKENGNPQLLRLQHHSKQLDRLQRQIHDLKTANLIPKLPEICALCVIEDSEVVLQFFVDAELESAFLLFEDHFTTKCISIYEQTMDSNHHPDDDESESETTVTIQLVDEWYSLIFRAPNRSNCNQNDKSNGKLLFFLTKPDRNRCTQNDYESLDMLHTLIIDSCCALQSASKSTTRSISKSPFGTDRKRNGRNLVHSQSPRSTTTATPRGPRSISTATALIEIADEVFGGGDSEMPLNEMEFATAMTVRLGLESLWESQTTESLQSLFQSIWNDIEEEERWYLDETPCIVFAQFVQHFNVQIAAETESTMTPSAHSVRSTTMTQRTTKSLWHSICDCIAESPLSRRNTKRRERIKWTVMAVKERLSLIERLVDLSEDIVILQMEQQQFQRIWRRKLLKNRDIIGQFREEIMTQILSQNESLKKSLKSLQEERDRETSQSVLHGVDGRGLDIEYLKEIESKYKMLVEQQKRDQRAMKEMEGTLRQKEDEIYKLKSQIIGYQTWTKSQSRNRNESQKLEVPVGGQRIRYRHSAHNLMSNGLLKLKGEIAQTKLDVQRQLESMSFAQRVTDV